MEKQQELFFNYLKKNIIFLRQGRSEKSYKIMYRNKKEFIPLKIKMEGIKIPFGIEKYKYKHIINLELINYKKNNKMYNLLNQLLIFDKFLRSPETLCLSQDILNKLKGKQYISCLKQSKNNPLLRVHIKTKGKTMQSTFYKNGNKILPSDIKNMICDSIIYINSLWITQTNYGVVFVLDNCHST